MKPYREGLDSTEYTKSTCAVDGHHTTDSEVVSASNSQIKPYSPARHAVYSDKHVYWFDLLLVTVGFTT